MTEKVVQNIYDSLFHFEGKKALKPYPIHKKLDTQVFGYKDIYEWIAKTYNFDSKTNVLDAGCGVGYGSIFLAQQFNCSVTGISISDAEIQKATEFTHDLKLDEHVCFKQLSFDDLPEVQYDFIMAIESVKHTLNWNKTIESLQKSLKPKGTLIIVDDFLVTQNQNSLTKKYARDWALKVLLKQDDFLPEFRLKKDLTPFVTSKNQFVLKIAILVLSILKPFMKVAVIMRGGLYLEQLFRSKVMKYYVIELKKATS